MNWSEMAIQCKFGGLTEASGSSVGSYGGGIDDGGTSLKMGEGEFRNGEHL